MRTELPSGTVTFLFTDIEGSTRLLQQLGAASYADALAEHRRILRDAFAEHGGVEVDTQGDAFFVAFPTAQGAVDAALVGLDALTAGPIRVRVGIHTGEPHLTDEGYVGEDVHRGARIGAAGHGGQILLSHETRALIDAEVTDLGEHRLKDFGEPVWIFQLGAARFPPLKSISNTNLPSPVSSFLGRERETTEILAALTAGARLLTLTGPGGTGKTRLSIEAATELVPAFRNGVYWIELAPLRDPSLVLDTVALTLGADGDVAEYVGDREMLLVLDNLEQVIECAPGLTALLESCPNLIILATSRELLRVRGEVEYPVPPLEGSEAVTLFRERSGLEPDDTIAELCRRLDHLPLAVELAAARTRALTPAQILERMATSLDVLKGGRDADPRQQTLRATIQWSHDLLDPEEQRLFAALAVFAGGCTLEAAEGVVGADLDTLQSLVEKSLVRFTDGRYWMLETIREFALERFDASEEAGELRDRLAAWVLAQVEEAEPHLRQESVEWLEQLDPEHDNVRAALDHLERAGEYEIQLRVVASFWRFWSLRGHIAEGRRRVETALAGDLRPTAVRAEALMGACDLAGDDDDRDALRRRAEEALALHRVLGDAWGEAYSLFALGLASMDTGDAREALASFEESARLFGELSDEHWTLQVNRRLAWSLQELGESDRARAIHEENVRRGRASGDRFIEARSLAALATYTFEDGRVDDAAIDMLEQAHAIHRDRSTLPDRYNDATLLCRFAFALALDDHPSEAVRLIGCADAAFEELGRSVESWISETVDETIEMIGDRLDAETITEAREQGRTMTPDEAVALAVDALRRE